MASLASEKCRSPDSSPATDSPPLVSERVRGRTGEKQDTEGMEVLARSVHCWDSHSSYLSPHIFTEYPGNQPRAMHDSGNIVETTKGQP